MKKKLIQLFIAFTLIFNAGLSWSEDNHLAEAISKIARASNYLPNNIAKEVYDKSYTAGYIAGRASKDIIKPAAKVVGTVGAAIIVLPFYAAFKGIEWLVE